MSAVVYGSEIPMVINFRSTARETASGFDSLNTSDVNRYGKIACGFARRCFIVTPQG